MHDDLLERRLRSALHEEAGRLPFAITAAELERRAALRGRVGLRIGAGNRRLTLVLAAALGLGALGVGMLAGGVVVGPTDATPPPSSAVVAPSDPTPSHAIPLTLPALEELIAIPGIGPVVVAQAHGPADAPEPWQAELPEPPPSVTMALPEMPGEIVVRLACLGDTNGVVRVTGRFPSAVRPARCDGAVNEVLLGTAPPAVTVSFSAPASWRLVVAQAEGSPPVAPQGDAPVLAAPEGEAALVDIQTLTMQPDFSEPDAAGRVRIELQSVTARWWYRYAVWCEGGPDVQYIHGDDIDGVFTPTTITQVPCNGATHEGELDVAEAHGSGVYLQAAPGTVVSLVVSAEASPIALHQQDGWQLSAGYGPDLNFDSRGAQFTGPGVEGGGMVMVALACAGMGTVDVTVDWVSARPGEQAVVTRGAEFTASCVPDGAVTAHAFAVEDSYVDVSYVAPAGTWTAMTVLIPEAPRSSD